MVERLKSWDDQRNWNEFFTTYQKLIHGVARKSGLTEEESQDVVQETILTVARNIDRLQYDPKIGSFKGWLMNITRWRIADQFRKRAPGVQVHRSPGRDSGMTATLDRLPGAEGVDLEAVWDAEWKENLIGAAMRRVRAKVDPAQFQIFDCYVTKGWSAQRVAKELGVNVGQVYLAKHRVSAVLKKEARLLENVR